MFVRFLQRGAILKPSRWALGFRIWNKGISINRCFTEFQSVFGIHWFLWGIGMSLFYFFKMFLKKSTCLKFRFTRKHKGKRNLNLFFFHRVTDTELNYIWKTKVNKSGSKHSRGAENYRKMWRPLRYSLVKENVAGINKWRCHLFEFWEYCLSQQKDSSCRLFRKT